MDIFARGLLAAADMLENSQYESMLKERYASYDSGVGAKFEAGEMTLEQVADYARTNGEVKSISGKQELYESMVNMYI